MGERIVSIETIDKIIDDLKLHLATSAPHDTPSFLQGYLSACRGYGVYNNGEQYIGGFNIVTVRQIREAIEKYTKQQL